MRRRGLAVVIIALVAAALFGTWKIAYSAGESDGRTKVSTDRSIFQTRVASGPQAGASGTGQNSGAGGPPGAAGARSPGGGSAAAGVGTAVPGAGGSAAAGRASGTPGTGRGAASSVVGRVTKVDGSTLSVQQTDNSTVSVTTNAETAVRKLVAGALTDLKAGDIVAVDGSKTGDSGFSAKSVTSLGNAGGAGAGGGRPQGGVPPAGAAGLVGQIKSVDGATIMVQGFDGTTTAVTTTPATVVRTQQAGTLADIKTGDTLLIQGDRTSDTAFLARSITNQGASG